MKAYVVYESLYGNTAAVASAIADGIGQDAQARPTDGVTPDEIAAADLVVAGAPVMAFRLPTDGIRSQAAKGDEKAPRPADLSHPSMRTWLETLPTGHGRSAAFETKLRWSPSSSAGSIERALVSAGYRTVTKAQKFVVSGSYGPLRPGELERARAWGRQLAASVEAKIADE